MTSQKEQDQKNHNPQDIHRYDDVLSDCFLNSPCFVTGTKIETKNGSISVEKLKAGDLVLTKDNGYKPIQWVGQKILSKEELKTNPKLYPIHIKAGALGVNTPSTDIFVSPQHRILVCCKIAVRMFGDWEVLIPAKDLLALDGVDYVTDFDELGYHHILFDQHEIIYANGAQSESLFTGPEALLAISDEAREEIRTLFPELMNFELKPRPARNIIRGEFARQLALQAHKYKQPVFQP